MPGDALRQIRAMGRIGAPKWCGAPSASLGLRLQLGANEDELVIENLVGHFTI